MGNRGRERKEMRGGEERERGGNGKREEGVASWFFFGGGEMDAPADTIQNNTCFVFMTGTQILAETSSFPAVPLKHCQSTCQAVSADSRRRMSPHSWL